MRVREGPGGVGAAQQQDAAGQGEAAEPHTAPGPLPARAQPVPAGRRRGSERGPAGAPAPLTAIPPSPPPRSPPSRARSPSRLQQRQRPRGHGGGLGPAGSAAGSVPRFRPRRRRAPPPGSAGGGRVCPARAKMAPLDLDKYVEIARLCKYLPENDLKVRPRRRGRDWPGRAGAGAGGPGRTVPVVPALTPTLRRSLPQRLCDYVCDLLLEESNVQPVSTPVTVCGDIHGQVGPGRAAPGAAPAGGGADARCPSRLSPPAVL